jgi:hypothetical protein
MKKTWLPSSLMTKFWDKPAGTEVSVPVQSELTVYVAVMSGMVVTTPLTTMVPLPVTPPHPVGDDPIHLRHRQALQIPPLFGHIGTVQGGHGALVGRVRCHFGALRPSRR